MAKYVAETGYERTGRIRGGGDPELALGSIPIAGPKAVLVAALRGGLRARCEKIRNRPGPSLRSFLVPS